MDTLTSILAAIDQALSESFDRLVTLAALSDEHSEAVIAVQLAADISRLQETLPYY